jgi:class 3 adenylate cyclase
MNSGFSTRFCRKCLAVSISIEDMNRFAKMTDPDYDLYRAYGFSKGHPIGIHEAADRIVADMVRSGYYIDFVETLIKVDTKGYMGHSYAFRGLDDVIGDVLQAGYSFDETTGQFFEDQSQQITNNWGRLMEGDERQMAVLRLDIAGNSVIVKSNPKPLVDSAFSDLRKIVTKAVVSRLGRLWTWEGDGALAVFMLGEYSRLAIFAGMEILSDMFVFNKTENPLNSAFKLRISVNSGHLTYTESQTQFLKADTVRTAVTLESKAAVPNSLVISESLALSQDQALLNIFSDPKVVSNSTDKYRIYQVAQGKE